MGGNTPLEGPLASMDPCMRIIHQSGLSWWLTLLGIQQKVKVVKWIGANWFGNQCFTSLNTASFHGLLCL
ncbi:hypothetical protein IMY05_016G0119400 [Salix suchowensis]|nr:hypothetical protein IMY05_016G0119400 [Salix suchowensis]